jgi:hypothetical protein
MSTWEFPASEPVELQVRVLDGDITVSAVATQVATVTIEDDEGDEFLPGTRVEFDDGKLSIVGHGPLGLGHGSVAIRTELPEGSSCLVDTTSADVRCTGRLGALDVHTISGDVQAEQVSGLTRVDTASGDIELGAVGQVRAETASGEVRIARAAGRLSVQTASGDVRVAEAAGDQADVKSASGDIRVAVAPGTGVYLDLSSLSGTVSSELEPAEDSGAAGLTLNCRSISGDVVVSRAAEPATR